MAAALEEWLIFAMPYWCIESWLYANTAMLRALVGSDEERDQVDRWAENLALLDEVSGIKEVLPSVRDRQNLDLVEPGSRFPAVRLREAGTSWHATMARLEASSRVQAFLHSIKALPH